MLADAGDRLQEIVSFAPEGGLAQEFVEVVVDFVDPAIEPG